MGGEFDIKPEGDTLSVKETKGKTPRERPSRFMRMQKTEYARGKTAAKFSDLKAGDRVVVHAMEMKGAMVAHEVKIAAAKATSKKAKK